MASSLALHHVHKRKRIYQNHEPYPHPNKWKRLLDKLIYFVAIAMPLTAIPQVIRIWAGKSADGVSIITWISWIFLQSVWLSYGIVHREKPIVIMSILWLAVDIMVIAGVLIYG